MGAPGWSPLTSPVKKRLSFYVFAVYTSSDNLRRCPANGRFSTGMGERRTGATFQTSRRREVSEGADADTLSARLL